MLALFLVRIADADWGRICIIQDLRHNLTFS
jgi:hypothetical protein